MDIGVLNVRTFILLFSSVLNFQCTRCWGVVQQYNSCLSCTRACVQARPLQNPRVLITVYSQRSLSCIFWVCITILFSLIQYIWNHEPRSRILSKYLADFNFTSLHRFPETECHLASIFSFRLKFFKFNMSLLNAYKDTWVKYFPLNPMKYVGVKKNRQRISIKIK